MENLEAKRERSALYPVITVDECFEIIETIDKIGGKVYSNSSVAQALHLSEKTNSFRAKISALRQYGLISGVQGTLKLTDIANMYLYPTKDEQKKEAKMTAFLNVALYKKLIERFENQGLPSPDKLANILLGKEFGLTKNTKDAAVEVFIKSLGQLNLLVNGVLVLNAVGDESSETNTQEDTKEKSVVQDVESVKEQSDKVSLTQYYNFEIPTLNGEVAIVKIPQNVTTKDLDFIQLYIENMLPVFLENLRNDE